MSQLSIGERIKFLLDAQGGSIRKFARMLDVSDTNIRNYIEKGTKPSSDVLEKLLQTIPHLNSAWLLTGIDAPFLDKNSAIEEPPVTYTKKNLGNAIGTNHGIATQSQGQTTHHDLAIKLEAAQELIQQLKSQLRDKEDIIELLRKAK